MTKLDCGHEPTPSAGPGTGYGTDKEGRKHCYECCNARELEQLKGASSFFAYISSDGKSITTWPGGHLGKVTHWGAVHPWSRKGWAGEERRYLNAYDVHGQTWRGTGAPGMWCSLQRIKGWKYDGKRWTSDGYKPAGRH